MKHGCCKNYSTAKITSVPRFVMPHFHHNLLPGRTQLYNVGETALERALDLCDELLADFDVSRRVRFAAAMAKDSLTVVRDHTLQPQRLNGPRRETVERARPSCGVDLISGEPIE